MLPLFGIFHFVALAVMTFYGLRTIRMPPATVAVAAFVIIWTNFVITGHLLSLAVKLNVPWLYATTSLSLGVLTVFGLRTLKQRTSFPALQMTQWLSAPFERWLIAFLLLTAGAFAVLTLVVAATHLANNPDTVVYRFARVFWYLGAGSLEHFSKGSDPRALYYPLNGVLLYLPLAVYQFGPLWFNLPTVAAWALIAVVVYAFGRHFGAPRIWAVAAAWLIVLTPNVLIQAVSTNDEILSAVAMISGLLFLFRWSRRADPLDLVFGTAGVCLSVGTKLHVSFYWLFLIFVLVSILWNWRKAYATVSPLFSPRGAVAILICAALAFVMVASFMVLNLRATGNLTEMAFVRQVLNTPWDWAVSLQTMVLYAAQIILAPLPDLVPTTGLVGGRTPMYNSFNSAFAPAFAWVNNGPAHMSVGYRFTGIVSSVALLFNEHTVFLGFSWLVGSIALVWIFTHRRQTPAWGFWICLSMFGWFATWASMTKYVEGIAVYLSYAAIISSPGWVFVFGKIESHSWNILRNVLIGIVFVTHLVSAFNVTMYNAYRSARAVFVEGAKFPLSPGLAIDESVKTELKMATGGITHYLINWGQPNWLFMAFNPQNPNFLRKNLLTKELVEAPDAERRLINYNREMLMPQPGDTTLHIYPIRQYPVYGDIPIKITEKESPGLTLIGDIMFALGPESVFAAGNGVEMRHPGKSGYVVVSFGEVSNFGHDQKPVIDVSPRLFGLGPTDDLSFRYIMKINDIETSRTDWSPSPAAHIGTVGLSATNGIMTIQIRNNHRNGAVDSVDVPLRSMASLKLPQ